MTTGMLILITILSFLLGGAGAFSILKFGHQTPLISASNERSSHSVPTPRGGGIGICVALFFVSAFMIKDLLFSFMAIAVGALGFLEDLLSIQPRLRLILQLVLSGIIAFFIPQSLGFLGSVMFLIFSTLFISGTANFYNFMDGINGIAAMTGAVGFGLMAYFGYFIAGAPNIALLAVAVSAACLGFMPFNVPKAKVFMGDVGSITLGFVFAVMAISLSGSALDFFCLVSFLAPFYVDALLTLYIRFRDGEGLMTPHRKHFYQFLANEKKIPHWKISLGYAMIQAVLGVSILFLRPLGIMAVLLMLVLYFAGTVLLMLRVRKYQWRTAEASENVK